MTEAFSCPNCGAPIRLEADPPPTVRCPHCGTSVIVPQSARKGDAIRPVVIRLEGALGNDAPRRIGRMLAVVIVVAIGATAALGIAGLVLGIGAATGAAGLLADGLAGPTEPTGPARQLRSFGASGIGPGFFTDARHVGLDADGNIYVGEYQGGRIQVFNAEADFVTQWFVDREFPLTGMAVRRDGNVYTVQRGDIVRRDGRTGEAIESLPYGEGTWFEDVALLADGGLLTSWYANRDDLVVFGPDGEWLFTVEEAISGQTGDSELTMKVAGAGNGDLLALGQFHESIFRFGPDGRFLNRFGTAGDESGQLRAPLSIAVDGQGRVYVGDIWGVEVFDLSGRYLDRIEMDGTPFGLSVDAQGHLWVVNGTQVVEYEVEGS
jgi:predicted RNA-binding Zn-ribbon protein involved in translation (DUF1610 family)